MTIPEDRFQALTEILERRVLVLDGAMGTMLQQLGLTAADFGGPELEGCNENLVRTRPDVTLGVHRAYLQAGADMVETNSFGCTPLVLAEYGLAAHAHESTSPPPDWRARRQRSFPPPRGRASWPGPWGLPPRRLRSPAGSRSRS